MADGYDVFLSHCWADHRSEDRRAERPQRAGVERLRDELRDRRLQVFYDEGSIDEFAPLAESILDALRSTKVFVSWCSDLYLSRPACESELTTAMCWTVDAEPQRVLVVNTEADVDHLPTTLRANLIPAAPEPDDAAGYKKLADTITARCSRITGTIGDAIGDDSMPWYPEVIKSSTRFTGRRRELWDLHGLLTSTALQSSKDSRRGVVVSGMGGSGKSLLVLEYGHRFGAAWPGGVVFLTGHGWDRDDIHDATTSSGHARAVLGALVGGDFNMKGVADMDLTELRSGIQRWFEDRGPALWIVDDLADDADTAAWIAPMDDAATVFTTRVRTYDGLFEPLHLEQLSQHDAFDLLTRDSPPVTHDQFDAAITIAERLGRHALALDVTRCRVQSADGYAQLLDQLDRRAIRLLERAGSNVGDLAVDHTASITATLQGSIDDLTPHGRNLLDIAACFDSVALPDDTLTAIVHSMSGGERHDATDDTHDGLADLERHSLARRVDASTILHRLVVDLARPELPVGRRTDVLARAEAVLAVALADAEDERMLRPRRLHYELASTLSPDPLTDLPIQMARYEVANGNPQQAIERLDELIRRRAELRGTEYAGTLAARHELALAHIEAGHYEAAIELHSDNLSARESLLGSEHRDTLDSRHGYGAANFWAGREALDILEETLAAREQVLGPEHPDTLETRHYLGRETLQVDLDRGIALLVSTVAARERVIGPLNLDTIESRVFLAQARGMAGDPARAATELEAIVEIMDREFGPEHKDSIVMRSLVGEAYLEAGDTDQVVRYLEEAAKYALSALGPAHPHAVQTLEILSRAHLATGDVATAIGLLEQIIAEESRTQGADHPGTLHDRVTLAEAYRTAGDLATAISHYESLVEVCAREYGRWNADTRAVRRELKATRKLQREIDSSG